MKIKGFVYESIDANFPGFFLLLFLLLLEEALDFRDLKLPAQREGLLCFTATGLTLPLLDTLLLFLVILTSATEALLFLSSGIWSVCARFTPSISGIYI